MVVCAFRAAVCVLGHSFGLHICVQRRLCCSLMHHAHDALAAMHWLVMGDAQYGIAWRNLLLLLRTANICYLLVRAVAPLAFLCVGFLMLLSFACEVLSCSALGLQHPLALRDFQCLSTLRSRCSIVHNRPCVPIGKLSDLAATHTKSFNF
jgi:hypothetical protein